MKEDYPQFFICVSYLLLICSTSITQGCEGSLFLPRQCFFSKEVQLTHLLLRYILKWYSYLVWLFMLWEELNVELRIWYYQYTSCECFFFWQCTTCVCSRAKRRWWAQGGQSNIFPIQELRICVSAWRIRTIVIGVWTWHYWWREEEIPHIHCEQLGWCCGASGHSTSKM